jgi:hypothetical protein
MVGFRSEYSIRLTHAKQIDKRIPFAIQQFGIISQIGICEDCLCGGNNAYQRAYQKCCGFQSCIHFCVRINDCKDRNLSVTIS